MTLSLSPLELPRGDPEPRPNGSKGGNLSEKIIVTIPSDLERSRCNRESRKEAEGSITSKKKLISRKAYVIIKDMFEVGTIMEWEDKSSSIAVLDEENCRIMSKALNKNKIILHMKRESDGSEGNVFVKLKDEFADQFPVSKKLFASKKVIGISLSEFKKFNIEEL